MIEHDEMEPLTLTRMLSWLAVVVLLMTTGLIALDWFVRWMMAP